MRSHNTSGYSGVCWSKEKNKWMAYAKLNRKNKFLGYWDTAKQASEVRENFCKQHYGEFFRVPAGIEAHFKGNDKVINLQSYVSGMRYE